MSSRIIIGAVLTGLQDEFEIWVMSCHANSLSTGRTDQACCTEYVLRNTTYGPYRDHQWCSHCFCTCDAYGDHRTVFGKVI